MYRTAIIIGILTSMFSCGCNLKKEDWLFNEQELIHFSSFEKGDTIVYSSNFGESDSILILEITDHITDPNVSCGGFMAPKLENHKSVLIQHLPFDKWKHITINGSSGDTIREVGQSLLCYSKFPELSETSFSISFKNFYVITDNSETFFHEKDTSINGLKYESYYKFEMSHPERLEDSSDISCVICTVNDGLTAYQTAGGHSFVKNKR